jgi:hypothetical protein
MTIERKMISTGIFEHEQIIIGPRTTKKEKQYLKSMALSRFDIEARLDVIEKAIRNYMTGVGVRFIPHGVDNTNVSAKARSNPAYGDASAILNYVGMLRGAMQDGNIKLAVARALDLGALCVQFDVRPEEKSAAAGREKLAYMQRLRERRSKKISAKHDTIIQLFNELSNQYEPHERPSSRKIANDVSKHLKIKFKTVESVLYRASLKTSE